MIPIYQGLSDDFDRHDGSLSPYVNAVNIALPYEKHYDLRAFHTTNLTVPWTLNDNTWWNGYRYPTFGVPQIGNQRSIVNVISRNRQQSELDVLLQSALDPLNQDQVEHVGVTSGNEEWPVGDANVTVGKDSSYRYSNTIRVTLAAPSTVTAAGNEVTDATRAAISTWTTSTTGLMWDGLSNDSSFGIRRTTSNNFRRGQCDATTDWVTNLGTETRSIDATTPPPFSTQSIKVICPGTAISEGILAQTATGLARPTGDTAVGSTWFKGVTGSNYRLYLYVKNTDATFTGNGSFTTVTASGNWQKIGDLVSGTPTPALTIASGKTGDQVFLAVTTASQRAETFWIAGAMIELGRTIGSPYVPTSGGSIVNHLAGRVQAAAAGSIDKTQGWVAARIRLGAPASATTSGSLGIFDWRTDANNRLALSFNQTTSKFRAESVNTGTSTAIEGSTQTFLTGDFATIIMSWTATSVNLSVNGGAFSTVARSTVPNPSGSNFDIGSLANSNQLDGDVMWFASGTGTLNNTDATTLNNFGNTDPAGISYLPGTATFVWKAKTTSITSFPKTINSYFTEDISTDFNDGGNYNLELVLRAFPSQADAAALDLPNSSIDISSDVNFASNVTDTLSFINSSTTINGTTGTFDSVATWPLSALTKANKSAIKAIRFNLAATGSMTFIGQALRIVSNGWSSRAIGLDTKRQTLSRQIPKAGGTEGSTAFGDIFFNSTRPKNITTYTLFNSGHLPATGSDDNIIKQYYRYNPTSGDRIEVRVVSRSTQTRLFIDQKIGGSTTNLSSSPTLSNILTAETDYYLIVSTNGTQVTATLYGANGPVIGSQIVTSTVTTSITTRGYLGYSFEPYNYDFSLRSLGSNTVDFGQLLSTNFISRKPVVGATLYPRMSPSVNMLTGGNIEAFADAALTVSSDATTYTVVRTGTAIQGGVRYNKAVYIGDTSQVAIEGKIFPVTQVRGTYRLGLIDGNDSVLWIYNFPSLLANQWNEFSVLLPTGINPVEYYLHVQQLGSYNDTFRVRDLSVSHNTVGWEATANGGTNWQPFLNALDDRWSAVKFGVTGKSLAVRATAKSDKAYVNGYNLVPRYIP